MARQRPTLRILSQKGKQSSSLVGVFSVYAKRRNRSSQPPPLSVLTVSTLKTEQGSEGEWSQWTCGKIQTNVSTVPQFSLL